MRLIVAWGAVLLMAGFQAPQLAKAAQIRAVTEAKKDKAAGDAKAAEANDAMKKDPTKIPMPLPDSPANAIPPTQPKEPEPPKFATVGELMSGIGVKKYPDTPFASESKLKKSFSQSRLSTSAAFEMADRSPKSLSGRKIKIEGIAMAVVPVSAKFRQVLVANPKSKRYVAFVITLPRGDQRELEVGEPVSIDAIAVQTWRKPKLKGALVHCIGGGLDSWADEGMEMQEVANTYGKPMNGDPSNSAKGDGHAWSLDGLVDQRVEGVAVLKDRDGKPLFVRAGQLIEPGVRVIKAARGAVILRIDNQEVTLRP